jgi:Spy/CpxP family protein refolding chaperone
MRYLVVTLTGALVLGLLAAVGPIAADEGRPAHGLGHLQRRLELTDDQMAVVREALRRQAEERRQLRQALRLAQVDLRQLALAGGAEDAVRAKTAEVQALLGRTIELRVKILQEIAPHLTPEQREKLAQSGFLGGRGRRHPGWLATPTA